MFRREVKAIHNDTQSGAAKIADKCLSTLKRECFRLNTRLDKYSLKTAIELLLDTHPMASIENALLPVFLKLIQLIEPDTIRNGDPKAAIELIFATRREQMRIGEINTIEKLAKVLQDKKSILTFSHSSTVTNALLQLAEKGFRDKEIFILESRPLKEGERIANILANVEFKNIHLGIDFAIDEFSQIAEVAVLGADVIHSNGQVLNKIGSATIAKLFHMQSKEVIIAASPSKICLRSIIKKNHDWTQKIPHRNSKEITRDISPIVKIWNKYYEIIQPEYISSLIMDCYEIFFPISGHISKFLEKDPLIGEIKAYEKIWEEFNFR